MASSGLSRRVAIVVGALLLIATQAGPASAQSPDQLRKWCFEDASHDQTIQGCGAVLRANRETPQDSANAYFNRGAAYAGKLQYERAIQDFDQAIKLSPTFSRALQLRGLAWANKRQFDRALKDYDEAIRLKSDEASTFENRCTARIAVKQLEQALADCNEALRLKPDSALQSRGLVYLKLGRLDAALADFEAALKRDPKDAVALFGRGIARRKKGDKAGGDLDISAAKVASGSVADYFARLGIAAN
jgi:tetratricopeptide (TPR) repeat protein